MDDLLLELIIYISQFSYKTWALLALSYPIFSEYATSSVGINDFYKLFTFSRTITETLYKKKIYYLGDLKDCQIHRKDQPVYFKIDLKLQYYKCKWYKCGKIHRDYKMPAKYNICYNDGLSSELKFYNNGIKYNMILFYKPDDLSSLPYYCTTYGVQHNYISNKLENLSIQEIIKEVKELKKKLIREIEQ